MAWQYLDEALEDWNNIPDTFKKIVAVAGTEVDWSAGAIYTKTLTGNTTLTFANPLLNKVITMVISGNFALLFPASVKIINGTYDGTVENYIQIHCVDSSTPSFWAIISQEAE